MKKMMILAVVGVGIFFNSCTDFMDIESRTAITDEAVWSSKSATGMYVNETYNKTLDGPLYCMTKGIRDWYSFDHAWTDDMGISGFISLSEFSFTAATIPEPFKSRWDALYENIRRTNLGLEKIAASEVLSDTEKERFLGDMYFLRALNYLELWRFWGGVPLVKKALNKEVDDIYYERSTSEETMRFIIEDFGEAAKRLPKRSELPAEEYGRATKGAAVGFQAVTYLHAAGVIDAKYYEDAANTADILINGELKGEYSLFRENDGDPNEKSTTKKLSKKAENFANLFLEAYEGNEEVIFDVQYKNPERHQQGYQTIAAPGYPGVGSDYGWGNSNPSQMLVDAFEMQDGTPFDWNDPEEAAHPYENRDARFYASILYDGVVWKDSTLSLSTNRYVWDENDRRKWKNVTDNLPNGLYCSKVEATKTGYFIRKHQNEAVSCGTKNRYLNRDGEGGNLIVLRYAEILLTYAEAKNEFSGPDQTVYDAINHVRRRAGQPEISGLGQAELRERIRNERRVELAFENKRYFDIMRWRIGDKVLVGPFYKMEITYQRPAEMVPTAVSVPSYNPRAVYFTRIFDSQKNYLLPIPQHAISRNPKLAGHQNPGW
ncbi:RagB/SusD family nutrient uptake outer membrane protein [Coprobacter secundus]|uniref:RagB/SusD family nutrient uptake outer membrane protein n=1 Tax=Coprobacter secundus TaxID=1501392 RepID=UPI0022DE9843|nr:RagB/SusD family nutrient uptake outer membrane protein [Coprobacter secundus]